MKESQMSWDFYSWLFDYSLPIQEALGAISLEDDELFNSMLVMGGEL